MELVPDANGILECSIEYYDAVPSSDFPPGTFDAARAKVQQEFDDWAGTLPALQPPYERARKTAAWVLWSSTVDSEAYTVLPSFGAAKAG